ncbi:hypothetical protein N9932_01090 [bacterium]|nr:hypothetical protein [bacterium]
MLERQLAQEVANNHNLSLALAESERKRLAVEKLLTELREKVPHDEPPNIVLAQDDVEKRFLFPSLQATVPEDFERLFKLENQQDVIDALNSESNIEVIEVIEVIGHTDNIQVGGSSNIDINLEAVFAGTKPVRTLRFGSNCELGLARAIAIKSMLERFLATLANDEDCGLTEDGRARIRRLTYRTYSAAQLFPADPANPGSDEDRRIEIRFTRLRKTTSEEPQ